VEKEQIKELLKDKQGCPVRVDYDGQLGEFSVIGYIDKLELRCCTTGDPLGYNGFLTVRLINGKIAVTGSSPAIRIEIEGIKSIDFIDTKEDAV
jgi:hypothetical protein